MLLHIYDYYYCTTVTSGSQSPSCTDHLRSIFDYVPVLLSRFKFSKSCAATLFPWRIRINLERRRDRHVLKTKRTLFFVLHQFVVFGFLGSLDTRTASETG